MPPRAKKPAAHDRHSNTSNSNSLGLAAPARRVSKQKSSSTPISNGHAAPANGHVQAKASPVHPPLADTPLGIHSPPGPVATVHGTTPPPPVMGVNSSQLNGRAWAGSVAAPTEDDVEAHGVAATSAESFARSTPLHIDVNASGAKAASREQQGSLAMATSILATYPLWDVIAMLIFLLQLPPTIISIVHLLFTCLTFLPISTGLSNLPTVQQIFMGTAGSPSPQTILIVDGLVLLMFLMLWTPVQNIALDLAQAVIAMSLSGAAASKGSATSSAVWCVVIIALRRLFRWKLARQFSFNLLNFSPPGFSADVSLLSMTDYPDLNVPQSWPRCILGVHILSQGVLRIVRRYLLWRVANSEPPSTQKIDPETGSTNSALSTPRTNSSVAEQNSDAPNSLKDAEGRAHGTAVATRENPKDRTANTKRKKKLATLIRMQQPLWAALANTRVTFLRANERSQASLDADEADSVDFSDMGNAAFGNRLDARVWITEIGATDIGFGVCFPVVQKEEDGEMDTVRPWSLRVNGAPWVSLKYTQPDRLLVGVEELNVWHGRIYGLTALSSYQCEFIKEGDPSPLYTVTLITQPAPSAEPATAIPSPTQTLRPSSPTTTLRNSIRAAEEEVDSHKNTLKSLKKQNKTALDRLQTQIERERTKLASSGGSDERNRQRAQQLERQIARLQADEQEARERIEETGEITTAEKAAYAKRRTEMEGLRKEWQNFKSRNDSQRAKLDQSILQRKSDIENVLHKRTRLDAKLKEWTAKIDSAEKAKKAAEDAQLQRVKNKGARMKFLHEQEELQKNALHNVEAKLAEETTRIAETQSKIAFYDELLSSFSDPSSTPNTPEKAPLRLNLSASASNSRPTSLYNPNIPPFSSALTSTTATGGTTNSSLAIAPPPGLTLPLHRRRASSLDARESSLGFGFPAPSTTGGAFPTFPSSSPFASAALPAYISAGFSTNGQQSPLPTVSHPAPVGEGRRKGSGGSGHSTAGSGGPFGSGLANGKGVASVAEALRGSAGLVSPVSVPEWEEKDAREKKD